MQMRYGITIKNGQIWAIGKKTRERIKAQDNLDFDVAENGAEVDGHVCGRIFMKCTDTGHEFEVKIQSLGKCISEAKRNSLQ